MEFCYFAQMPAVRITLTNLGQQSKFNFDKSPFPVSDSSTYSASDYKQGFRFSKFVIIIYALSPDKGEYCC